MNLDFESFLGHNLNGGKSIRFNHLVSQPRPTCYKASKIMTVF